MCSETRTNLVSAVRYIIYVMYIYACMHNYTPLCVYYICIYIHMCIHSNTYYEYKLKVNILNLSSACDYDST